LLAVDGNFYLLDILLDRMFRLGSSRAEFFYLEFVINL